METRNLLSRLTNLPIDLLGDLISRPDQEEIAAALASRNASEIAKTLCVDAKLAKSIAYQVKQITNEQPEAGLHVNLERYAMREFRAEMFLDEEDRKLRQRFYDAEKAEMPYQEMLVALEAWKQRVSSLVQQPIVIMAVPEFVSQPQSIMSDYIGVSYSGHPTDKVAIADHQVPVNIWDNKTFTDLVGDPGLITNITKQIKAIQGLYVLRLVLAGIVCEHNHYYFFTSAPSQLKKGSAYLMRKEEYNRYNRVWWGGLNHKIINDKGGIVMTKWLQQFRALCCTAAAPSHAVLGKAITLDDCVCVPEITTKLAYDNVWKIDDKYNVAKTAMNDIDFSPFDGAALLDESVYGPCCLQLRAYGCKGLGISFDLQCWCAAKKYQAVVTDIDGKQINVIKEHKSVILNDTVFKLAKYYGTWTHYVETMRELGLMELYICGVDEEELRNKALSRQSLQTLFCATDEEIEAILTKAKLKMERLQSKEGVYDLLAETGIDWDERSNMGKLVAVYPEMLSMAEVTEAVMDKYDSAFNKIMYGKLPIKGEFHYASPDLAAYCDCLFGGKRLSDPDIGLLKPYQIACKQHDHDGKLKDGKLPHVSLVRYPHAFFEWVNVDVVKNDWFTTNAAYFSVKDLCYRILQMDVDGDHVLTVENETIYRIVDRIRNDYQMPVLVYDPTNGGKIDLPADRTEFAKAIRDCIMACLETNKVGSYSKLITSAWSRTTPGMLPSDHTLSELLKDTAIIACGINHAVDSQKTGKLYQLERWNRKFVQKYKPVPYSQRYRDASIKVKSDDPEWDKQTMTRGEGSVERMERIMELYAPHHLALDTTDMQPSWEMLMWKDWGNGAIDRGVITQETTDLLNQFGKVRLVPQPDGTIGLNELTASLASANGAFWASFERQENDGIMKTVTKDNRLELIRQIYLQFVKRGDLLARRGMQDKTDAELIRWIVNKLVMSFWKNKKAAGIKTEKGMLTVRKFIINSFGDVMAEAVVNNRRDNTVANPDREAFAPLTADDLVPEEAPLNLTEYDIPTDLDEDSFFDYCD